MTLAFQAEAPFPLPTGDNAIDYYLVGDDCYLVSDLCEPAHSAAHSDPTIFSSALEIMLNTSHNTGPSEKPLLGLLPSPPPVSLHHHVSFPGLTAPHS